MARSTTWSAGASDNANLAPKQEEKRGSFACFACGVRLARAYNFVIRRSNRAPHFSSFSSLYKITVFCYLKRLLLGFPAERSMLKNVQAQGRGAGLPAERPPGAGC